MEEASQHGLQGEGEKNSSTKQTMNSFTNQTETSSTNQTKAEMLSNELPRLVLHA